MPAAFVVGAPRSGTTLLRLMLDSHPVMAIPPETGWAPVAVEVARRGGDPDDLLEAIKVLTTWLDLGFDTEEARGLLHAVRPWAVGEGLRALYRAYAARSGKPRFGDKTPMHVRHMHAFSPILPEAHFIHLIRDGRDVAASLRGLHFAPGDGTIEAIARDWHEIIVEARGQAAELEHYREVRYERLVREPESTLRELCEWLELPWDDAVLRSHERAHERLGEVAFARRDGAVFRTREERRELHGRTSRAPDDSRVGRWRDDLSAEEVTVFESLAGGLLAELGYEISAPVSTRG